MPVSKWIVSGSYGVQVEAENAQDAVKQAKELKLKDCAYDYKVEKHDNKGFTITPIGG